MFTYAYIYIRGLRGRVVKVADLRSEVSHRCRFDPHSGRNLSCEEAAGLRKVDGSTEVPARALNNDRRGTWGLAPPIKAGKKSSKKSRRDALGWPTCAATLNKRIKNTLICTSGSHFRFVFVR
jgi:hypothetical protein